LLSSSECRSGSFRRTVNILRWGKLNESNYLNRDETNDRYRSSDFLVGSVGFLLAFGIPGIPILTAWWGVASNDANIANIVAFLPLAIAYIVVPVVETIFPYAIVPVPPNLSSRAGWQTYYRVLPLLSILAQITMLYAAINYWNSGILNLWGGTAYLLSTGIFSGMCAINIGHELIHRPQKFDRAIGGLLLSTVGFGTFKIVHLKIHHRYVGTPLDFATAKRGQSIYNFWWQSFKGNVCESLSCERDRLTKSGQSFWHNELLLWYGITLFWLCLAISLGGWSGGIFFILHCLIAIMKLEWTNYLQHYGMTRNLDESGEYEPVKAHHAWSSGLFIHDLALLNLLRHSDHHLYPHRPYHALRYDDRTPHYPYNYSIMYFLSLVPPLFQKVVHPYLEN
jgi:alkane 1-monooxygenase